MKTLIIFLLLYLVLAFGTDYYLKKTYQIDRKKNVLEKKQKKLQSVLLTTIYLMFIISAIYMIAVLEEYNTVLVVLPFLLATTLIRGIFQRLYNRQDKIWILEYNQAIWIVVMYLLVLF